MKRIGMLTALALLATLAGCKNKDDSMAEPQVVDVAMVEAIRLQPIEQAIIVQHTLYPYHFVEGKADLNELGRRDLRVLAEHYRDQFGPLNVQQGPAGEDLYEARIEQVIRALTDSGIAPERIQIAQDLPGGSGLPGTWVLQIMSAQRPGQEGGQGKTAPTINLRMEGSE